MTICSALQRTTWLVPGFAAALCLLGFPAAARQPIEIGDRTQVFIDGRYLEQAENVEIVVCPPQKTNEKCLVGGLRGYGSIMAVDGVFRGFDALSKDGTHWRRVPRGTPPERDDIVGYRNGMPVVFKDPSAPPRERYKLANPKGHYVRASADGGEWQDVAKNMFPREAHFPRGMDSQNVIFYDTRLEKYVGYVRVNKAFPVPPERRDYFAAASKRAWGEPGYHFLRSIGRSVTDDLSDFPMPEVVFAPDEKDPRFGGVGVLDFYNPNVIQYDDPQDAYFLFTPRYLHYEDWFIAEDLSEYPRSQTVGILNTGPEDLGFAASRDGVTWQRYDRRPWISLGMEGAFDSKNMYPARGMVDRGREIWMYYTGYDTLHGDVRSKQTTPVLSRVVLRKHGFTAVEADYTGGEFTTCPLIFDGEALHLNLNTSSPGILRVEIQDANGSPCEGYGLEDCDRVHTANTIDRIVSWNGQTDVSKLAGKPVRLRFELRYGVKLNAFRFGGPERAAAALEAVRAAQQPFDFTHHGMSDPATEGWPVHGRGLGGRPVENDLGAGDDAWRIEDDQSVARSGVALAYRPELNEGIRRQAVQQGWSYRIELGVEDEPETFDGSVQVEVSLHEEPVSARWILVFTTDDQGHAQVAFRNESGEVDRQTVTTAADSGYHVYEMRFDPESGTVDLLIDDTPAVRHYPGTANDHQLNRIAWGAMSSPGTGTGYWHHVSFDVNAADEQGSDSETTETRNESAKD